MSEIFESGVEVEYSKDFLRSLENEVLEPKNKNAFRNFEKMRVEVKKRMKEYYPPFMPENYKKNMLKIVTSFFNEFLGDLKQGKIREFNRTEFFDIFWSKFMEINYPGRSYEDLTFLQKGGVGMAKRMVQRFFESNEDDSVWFKEEYEKIRDEFYRGM